MSSHQILTAMFSYGMNEELGAFHDGTNAPGLVAKPHLFKAGALWSLACSSKCMILLITPSARGQECADTLKEATGDETHWAENLQQALARLRQQSYSIVVIDQFLLENEPGESDHVFDLLGTAFPVYLNFAVSGMQRLLREVRSAVHRRQHEEMQARRSVAQQIHSEMFESLTAMLLSCELAIAVPGVPPPAAEKIRLIDNLARDMRIKLGAN